MVQNKNLVSTVAVAMVLGCSVTHASEEAAPASEAGTVEATDAVAEIQVIGSRIRGVAPVGSPLINISRDDIATSGQLTTVQLLQQLPQVLNYGISENSRSNSGGSGNTTYNSSINLRGLGPFATLTMIDGNRAVPVGIGGQSIDPSAIPMLMTERIDIVADGASALYGSDAVAGVVNIVLRRNVEGVEANVYYGTAADYHERTEGLVWGHTWSSGQVTIGFENSYHSALNGSTRDFYSSDLVSRGGPDARTTQCDPGTITVAGTSYAIPAAGVTPATANLLIPKTSNRCDNIKNTDFFPEIQHNNVAFTFDQELSSIVKVRAEGYFHHRDYFINGLPAAATLTVPNSNAFFVAPPGTTPASESVAYSFANAYGPTTPNEGYSQAFQLIGGIDVKLPHDWKVATTFSGGQDDDRANGYPTITHLDPTRLAAALASSNPTTALNVFGGSTNPAVLAGLRAFQNPSIGTSKRYTVESTADGPIVDLPGTGELRGAVGVQYYKDMLDTGTDTITSVSATNVRKDPSRDVSAVYAEFNIPIFGTGNALPGLRKLDLDLAERHERYSDVGGTSNPKVGLDWSPLEGVQFRGSYGRSVRAPNLSQIVPTTSGLFVQTYPDPTSPTGSTTGTSGDGCLPGAAFGDWLQPTLAAWISNRRGCLARHSI